MDFLKQPDVTIVQALLLQFRPVNMDVLPLYIVLMLSLPLILVLMRRKPDVTLALSAVLYAATWEFDLYLTAYPNGYWEFNPFAWQLLFVFGAWCALGGARRMSRILSSPITLGSCVVYLVFAFYVTLTWYVPTDERPAAEAGSSSGCIRSTRPTSTCCASRISSRLQPSPCDFCRRTGRA